MADLTPFGAVADLANNLIDRFFPNKSELEKQQMAAAIMMIQGQLNTNQEEAKSGSVFVAGWRPFIGWVCGSACAWNWIGLPVAKFGALLLGYPIDISPADLTEMFPVLLGMLGLAGYRSFEKVKGVASK